MAGFTKKIVDMMKEEELFETQGGPIILSQVNGLITPSFNVISIDYFFSECV